MPYEQEILDSLTDEEREALNEDDGSGDGTNAGGAEAGNEGDDKGGDDGKGQQGDKGLEKGKEAGVNGGDAAGDDGKGKGADGGDAGGDDTGKQSAGDADDSATTAKEPVVPLLVANAPADADAKLKEISDKKASILQQFDDGDITAKEYQSQLDTLNKDERSIERQVEKAQLATEMKQQQEMGSWLKQVTAFTSETHAEYSKSRSRWNALDTFVKEIAAKPENQNLEGRKILEMAHQMVIDDLGEAPTAKKDEGKEGKPLKGSKIEPPKTLGKVPAADNTEIADGKFAALDRLAETDPEALEDKMMKMSPADRDEYLASRG